MSESLVVDASVVVSALVDLEPDGDGAWVRNRLPRASTLVAPHVLLPEVASVLRRLVAADVLSIELATLSHADLLEWPLVLYDYQNVGERIWELRDNLKPYDAWYVAVAELTGLPLVTLDFRLTAAPGPRCEFLWPQKSPTDQDA